MSELDPKEEWIKLNRRINLAYYIGLRSLAAIHKKVTGEDMGGTDAPQTLGLDVDGDGEVDVTYTKDK